MVADQHAVEVYAELGVVFLLFVVGLHVSLDRLKSLAKPLVLGGGLHATLTTATVVAVGLAADLSLGLSLFLGFVVLMSSTAIVLKLYAERDELEAPHGQLATAILLFQDFLIVPLLLLVPILAGQGRRRIRRAGGSPLRRGGWASSPWSSPWGGTGSPASSKPWPAPASARSSSWRGS